MKRGRDTWRPGLLRIAEVGGEKARFAFRRVGMQEGWHVIDCGCGPIGGLAVMAEMVGPAGRVVGVDVSEPAVQRARSLVTALQLGNVEVVAGDIHELDAAAVGWPVRPGVYAEFPDAPA
jgi:cyclopropane fatty-acyl-phospholipid synthase-like methyltransferase